MKKTSRKFQKKNAARRKALLGRCAMGASLLVLGAQAHADSTAKQQQAFEGGKESYSNWVELSIGNLLTSGYAAQAQQRERLNTGAFGGIEDLHYQTEVAKKTTFSLDGRAIVDNHDYKLGLKLEREDVGYVRFYFENFRTWDANDGGFSPVDQVAYKQAGSALALDRGQISLEAVYDKEDRPKVSLKYTHSYRDGQKGSTIWGPVHDSSGDLYRLYPNIYDIDESSDAVQLDITNIRVKKTQVGFGVRYEASRMNDAHELTFFSGEPIQQISTDRQETTSDLLSVHATTENWFKEKYFLSTGFLFENLDDTFTGSRIYGDDFDVVYSPAYPANYFGYYNLNGGAHRQEYVMNVNFMAMPTKTFTITPSLRVEKDNWDAHSTEIATWYDGAGESQSFANSSGRDSLDVRERLELRYTGMTNWVYTATADWTEGQGNLNESGGITQLTGAPDGQLPVLFRTDDSRFFQKYALSARWYPARQASVDVGGYYKINRYNYDNTQDSTPNDLSAGVAYPAFLVYQGFETLDGYTRLTLRPWSKVTFVSRYEYQDSTIATEPDPVSGLNEVDSSRMHSHIFGQNASWVPVSWLALQAGFNYVVSETKTPASDYTQAILNAQNNYWTVNFNSDFVLDDKTDLDLGYYYYRAADSQNGMAVGAGVPLGTDAQEHSVTATLTRRITKNLRWNLRYAFTHYEDYASLGSYNFDAHVIFSSLQYRF